VVHPIVARLRGSDPLILGVLHLTANFDSCDLLYRRCGGTHYPLIEGIAPDQYGELDLVPCGPSPSKINSNRGKLIKGGSLVDLVLLDEILLTQNNN
jgi:hypothetical protein